MTSDERWASGAGGRYRELAQQLLNQVASQRASRAGAAPVQGQDAKHTHEAMLADAIETGTCVIDRLRTDLSRWFGSDGLQALVARALDRTRPGHPILALLYAASSDPAAPPTSTPSNLARAAASGASASAALEAFTALLAEILALLARLVGDDMALRLVEPMRADRAAETPLGSGNAGNNSEVAQ